MSVPQPKIMALSPSSGIGKYTETAKLIIRLVKKGCTNRPFFHIVVADRKTDQHEPVIEQIGTYDPYPNYQNEKLLALNLERTQHWVGKGADVTKPVAELLGLCGFFPIHPRTYMLAWRHRNKKAQELKNEQIEAKE